MKVETRRDTRAFVMSLLLLGGSAAAPAADPQISREAINGLQMAIQIDGTNGVTSPVLKPGIYAIGAQFTGRGVSSQNANLDMKGLALMPYWQDAITSNHLRFEVAGR